MVYALLVASIFPVIVGIINAEIPLRSDGRVVVIFSISEELQYLYWIQITLIFLPSSISLIAPINVKSTLILLILVQTSR